MKERGEAAMGPHFSDHAPKDAANASPDFSAAMKNCGNHRPQLPLRPQDVAAEPKITTSSGPDAEHHFERPGLNHGPGVQFHQSQCLYSDSAKPGPAACIVQTRAAQPFSRDTFAAIYFMVIESLTISME